MTDNIEIEGPIYEKWRWESKHVLKELRRLGLENAIQAKKLEILSSGIKEALEGPEEAVTIIKNALELSSKVISKI